MADEVKRNTSQSHLSASLFAWSGFSFLLPVEMNAEVLQHNIYPFFHRDVKSVFENLIVKNLCPQNIHKVIQLLSLITETQTMPFVKC